MNSKPYQPTGLRRLRILFFLAAIVWTGCSSLSHGTKSVVDSSIEVSKVVWESSIEVSKVIWGSSTKALEDARLKAAVKTYPVAPKECFDEILKIAQEGSLEVFIKDRKKNLIVLMHIPGSIETTEAGVFLNEVETTKTKLEIVSLSPDTQEKTAEIIFSHFNKAYSEVK